MARLIFELPGDRRTSKELNRILLVRKTDKPGKINIVADHNVLGDRNLSIAGAHSEEDVGSWFVADRAVVFQWEHVEFRSDVADVKPSGEWGVAGEDDTEKVVVHGRLERR